MRGKTTISLLLALCGLGACQGAPAPLRPTATAYRGQKARVFPNTPEEVWAAACGSLVDQGFALNEHEVERGFIHAHTIELEGTGAAGGSRTWTRVTARIDFVDKHKRAPRALLEVEAERLHGTSEGAFEASIGELGVDWYERFFRDIEARLPVPRLPMLAIPGFE